MTHTPQDSIRTTGTFLHPNQMSNLHPSLSMSQMHFIATGEELPDLPGNACPRPVEDYINRTQQRQQRERAYKKYYDQMRQEGVTVLEMNQIREIGSTRYNCARLQQDVPGAPIFLYLNEFKVLELWQDGRDPRLFSPAVSGAASPCVKIQALPPGFARSRVASPFPQGAEEEGAGAAGAATGLSIQPPTTRLRTHFREFLRTLPYEALLAEYEEWDEEMKRAIEHLEAVEEEIGSRKLGGGGNASS